MGVPSVNHTHKKSSWEQLSCSLKLEQILLATLVNFRELVTKDLEPPLMHRITNTPVLIEQKKPTEH